jgi:hypothetical protein
MRVTPGITQLLRTPSAAAVRDSEVERFSRAALAAE